MVKRDSASIRVINPQPGGPGQISRRQALTHCNNGVAYLTREGGLKFRGNTQASVRAPSDVYLGNKVIYWNGSDSRPNAMHRPGENVQFKRPDENARLKSG